MRWETRFNKEVFPEESGIGLFNSLELLFRINVDSLVFDKNIVGKQARHSHHLTKEQIIWNTSQNGTLSGEELFESLHRGFKIVAYVDGRVQDVRINE